MDHTQTKTQATVIAIDADSMVLKLESTGQLIQWPHQNLNSDLKPGQKLLLALSTLPAELIKQFVDKAQNQQTSNNQNHQSMLQNLEALIN